MKQFPVVSNRTVKKGIAFKTTIKIYCLCRHMYVTGQRMIQCHSCRDWFHASCLQLSDSAFDEAAAQTDYSCKKCMQQAYTNVCPNTYATILDEIHICRKTPYLLLRKNCTFYIWFFNSQSTLLRYAARIHYTSRVLLFVLLSQCRRRCKTGSWLTAEELILVYYVPL